MRLIPACRIGPELADHRGHRATCLGRHAVVDAETTQHGIDEARARQRRYTTWAAWGTTDMYDPNPHTGKDDPRLQPVQPAWAQEPFTVDHDPPHRSHGRGYGHDYGISRKPRGSNRHETTPTGPRTGGPPQAEGHRHSSQGTRGETPSWPTPVSGVSLAYDLVRRGDWPTPVLHVGKLIKIPSAPLLALLSERPEVDLQADVVDRSRA